MPSAIVQIAGKPILRQQLQQQRAIPAIVFLPWRFRLSNRRGMSYATLDRELLGVGGLIFDLVTRKMQ